MTLKTPVRREAAARPNAQPPRENLFRAAFGDCFELRDTGDSSMPTLTGHGVVFNQWTEINSLFEGRFLERIAPGAAKKTIQESRDRIKVLFQHGMDPQVGDKPLGPLTQLHEDDRGVYYEAPLLDTSYNRDLIPGLKAGLYGASFRFGVVKEDVVAKPKRSDYNPDGLPERTITELRLAELGPVTFPAYAGATAGVRSITDKFVRLRPEVRADMPSLSVLTDMYALGQQFIELEVDPDDAPDRDAMSQILEMIEGLIETEATEDPASEMDPASGGRSTGAADGHSSRTKDDNEAERRFAHFESHQRRQRLALQRQQITDKKEHV